MSESSRSRIRELIHKGNVRHVVVEKDGRRSVDLPVNVVVAAAILGVWVVGILLILAVVSGYTISVEDHEAEAPAAGAFAEDTPPGAGAPTES